MTDYTLEDTIFSMFTTRAFTTGIPTVLAGSPVVSAYENDSATQITAGITLGVSHDSVVGMNLVTVAATAGNGYESGKDYNLVVTTGTVGTVSVIGEVVGTFSIGREASFGIVNDGVFGNSALNDSIGNISGSGTGTGAVNASGATITTGTETNTFTATQEVGGLLHIVEDDGGNTTFEYTVTLAANQSVANVTWRGYVQSNNDTVEVQFFNYNTSSFVTEETLLGNNGTTLSDATFVAVSDYTGIGANLGEVRLRFLSTTSTAIATDRLRFVFSSNFQSVGYADGAIWVDTIKGAAGTTTFINGTADNTVLTYADALTLSTALTIDRFRIINGSSITLTSDSTSFSFIGDSWFLALGGQDISSISVSGANISGIGINGGSRPVFDDCVISDVTLPPIIMTGCGFAGTITAGTAGDFNMLNCASAVAGTSTPVFDFGALLGDTNLNLRAYAGGIELLNMGQVGTDKASIDGDIKVVLNASCVGGTLVIRGNVEIVDNTGGAVTIEKIASTSRSAGYSNASLWHNGTVGNTSTDIFIDGTADNPVSTIAAMDTLSAALNLKKYSFVPGDNITLAQNELGKDFSGNNYIVNLNGQVPPTIVRGAEITGVTLNTTTFFCRESRLGTTSTPLTILGGFVGELCGIVDIVISGSNSDVEFLDCHGNTQGSMSGGSLDLKSGVTTNEVAFQRWGGPITFKNMSSGDSIFMHGRGIITLDASCAGGTLRVSGTFSIVDNAGGVVTIIDETQYNQTIIKAEVDQALIDYDAATGTAISGIPDLTLAAGDIDGHTLEEALKLNSAALAGKLAGAATSTNTIRAVDDSKVRITATVDADGNRTAVTTDVTG